MIDAPSHFEYVIDQRDSTLGTKSRAFWFMDQLEGWCTKQKASVLMDIIIRSRPQIVVEIGVWGGKSLVPMASALEAIGSGKIYGIDPWDPQASIECTLEEPNIQFWGSADHKAIKNQLVSKIHQFGLQNHVELIEDKSENVPPIENIDVLHIDGNHSDTTSFLDVTKWVPYVKKGGWIIFDDMTWHENDILTTSRAVEWLDEHCQKIGVFSDICVWGIWVKK
jgi:predicted O-methyltransferase YrrM